MAAKTGDQIQSIIPAESVQQSILMLQGHRVMLDSVLAKLYGVQTKALNRAVKRNIERFPAEFMFQLTQQEAEALRYQIGTSKGRGGRRYLPYAFTEHGAVMLASVLNSPTAVAASIQVVKAFVRLRELLETNHALAAKLAELERKVGQQDQNIKAIFDAIRQLMSPPPEQKKPPIGYRSESDRPKK